MNILVVFQWTKVKAFHFAFGGCIRGLIEKRCVLLPIWLAMCGYTAPMKNMVDIRGAVIAI